VTDVLGQLRAALADRYQLDRELGAGGMATVYLAQDLKHHRRVAVKVLRPELAATLGPERFLREIEIAAQLHHPHILPLYDSGEAGGFLFYVMPYEEGQSLRQRLVREGELPVSEAARLLRDVVDALAHAHEHGVVHRDIKPENILLSGHHALVTDFGVAKAVSEATGREQLTTAGVALGTPAYMAPEQAAADPHVDHRADLYAVGVVAYELLTGRPPFEGLTPQAVLAAHLTEEPQPVTTRRPTVPLALAQLVMRCLAKKPAERPQSADELLPVLESLSTPSRGITPTDTRPVPGVRLRQGRRWALFAAAVIVVGLGLAVARMVRLGPQGPRHPRTAIAVLPFQNLSGEGPNAYFAGGLHDEMLTQLAKVGALTVMGRTSVSGYAGTTKPLSQIAQELGVGSILEGSVQVIGPRLRVNVQLLDAGTGGHLWAERYDRTLDDAFAVQSEIAQQVVTAVGAALTGAERSRVAVAPTTNAEAYQLYLQGREYQQRPGQLRENYEIAQRLYERAVALDPAFALAHAYLSMVHGEMHWVRYDPTPARVALQRTEAETALRLAPTLPEAHMAMGVWHYYVRDYEAALDELEVAARDLPNDATLVQLIGYVNRRMGNWSEVFAAVDRSAAIDPRNADVWGDLGAYSFQITHRYPEAARAYDRAIVLAPDVPDWATGRAWLFLEWQGELDSLRTVLADLPPATRARREVSFWYPELALWERQPDTLLGLVREGRSIAREDQRGYVPGFLYAAWAQQLRGDMAAAHAAFDSARLVVDSAVREQPEDERVHAALGYALAGLGDREGARREASWLAGSVMYRNDGILGPWLAEQRAQILAQSGHPDGALDELERLLAGNSETTVHTLRLDPRWDPIRNDKRFQVLLVKYANPEAGR
jgi:TolB-like protein/tRNA A-37 threonylcarbamoyl transferase component Bud32